MLKKFLASFRIKEIQKKWTLVTEKLSVLEGDSIVETRPEERFRLEKTILKLKEERQQLEQELLQIETEIGEEVFSNKGLASDGQDIPKWPATPWWVSALTGTKLRYLVLLLIFGGGVWGSVNLLPNPDIPQTNGKAAEKRILQLEPEYERLRADFKSIDNYPKVRWSPR